MGEKPSLRSDNRGWYSLKFSRAKWVRFSAQRYLVTYMIQYIFPSVFCIWYFNISSCSYYRLKIVCAQSDEILRKLRTWMCLLTIWLLSLLWNMKNYPFTRFLRNQIKTYSKSVRIYRFEIVCKIASSWNRNIYCNFPSNDVSIDRKWAGSISWCNWKFSISFDDDLHTQVLLVLQDTIFRWFHFNIEKYIDRYWSPSLFILSLNTRFRWKYEFSLMLVRWSQESDAEDSR